MPAYLVGLVVAGVFLRDRVIVDRLRTLAFALLTPFFFLRAGLLVCAPALLSGLGVIELLFLVKMLTKLVAAWPVSAAYGMPPRERSYTTLLLATGLTFGSIAAPYGLTNHLIDQKQYSILVTVVILSAFVPTLVAQRWFHPELGGLDDELEETPKRRTWARLGHVQGHRHEDTPDESATGRRASFARGWAGWHPRAGGVTLIRRLQRPTAAGQRA